jgi:hypothetical protein
MTSYLVRVWEPVDHGGNAGPQLRGVVRHVPSGEERAFASEDELLTVLRAGVTGAGIAGQVSRTVEDGGK